MGNNYYDYLNIMFDKYIIADLKEKNKKENPSLKSVEELADYLIKYVKRYYTIYEDYISPNISNFYSKDKKFTRFILICLSLFDSESDINTLLKKYRFNEELLWEIEHIIPQKPYFNKLNKKNSKLKNRIGNLTLLKKETNGKISNESFVKKKKNLTGEEKYLKFNDIFKIDKIHISKKDICEREKEINKSIYDIFIKDRGKLLQDKLHEFIDAQQSNS